jgi:hypothetical protein
MTSKAFSYLSSRGARQLTLLEYLSSIRSIRAITHLRVRKNTHGRRPRLNCNTGKDIGIGIAIGIGDRDRNRL